MSLGPDQGPAFPDELLLTIKIESSIPMKPIRSILAIALLAALPAVGSAQTSAKTSPSPATTTKSSPATTKSPATTTTTTTASSPATTTTTTTSSPATTSPAAARTDVYHVHFSHAGPGKATALADGLKQPAPNAP